VLASRISARLVFDLIQFTAASRRGVPAGSLLIFLLASHADETSIPPLFTMSCGVDLEQPDYAGITETPTKAQAVVSRASQTPR
jgi:hypothetical protein